MIQTVPQRLDRVGGQGDELGRAVPRRTRVLADVLLEHRVKIASTEPEGTHTRPARMAVCPKPRPGLGVEVERAVVDLEPWIGLADLDRRRQHLMVQGQCRLDQSRGAGCSLGVSDLRLDRSERAPRSIGVCRGVHGSERVELDGVADRRARAVGLDQLHRRRVDPAHRVGVAERPGLSRRAGGVNALRAAVARRADSANHRVDTVTVALGVRQTLEYHHAQTFADYGAVGVFGERPGVPRRRQRLRLAEAHEHEDVVERVDAA